MDKESIIPFRVFSKNNPTSVWFCPQIRVVRKKHDLTIAVKGSYIMTKDPSTYNAIKNQKYHMYPVLMEGRPL